MDSEKLAELVADACDDRKATDIRLIRVDEVSSLADWMVIAGGQSDVQVRAIARSVEDHLEAEADPALDTHGAIRAAEAGADRRKLNR